MHPLLQSLRSGLSFTGEAQKDVPHFLQHHGCQGTAAHSARVAREARRVAQRVGADPQRAELAGWLHDVSAVIPAAERASLAHRLGIDVLPEEERFPLIVHQKLSVVLARELFEVTDPLVLDAVGCHTTLRRQATLLDRVLFVADKIEWDQQEVAPYRAELLTALDRSLDDAALLYLRWMHQQRESLRVVHPWLREAYEALSGQPW